LCQASSLLQPELQDRRRYNGLVQGACHHILRSVRPFHPRCAGYISYVLLRIVSPQKLASSIYSKYVLHVSNKFDILCVVTCNIKLVRKKGIESLAYLDPKMMMRTQILLDRDCVVKYMIKAMRHHNDKEMLIILSNMGNHWLLLSISTTYDQV
jgi:hypothetical protein